MIIDINLTTYNTKGTEMQDTCGWLELYIVKRHIDTYMKSNN